MAKNKKPEVKTEQKQGQKVQTKYDRKMEARRLQEEKDRRDAKRFKIGSIIVAAVVVVSIVTGIGISIFNRFDTLNGTYFKVGDRDITKLEFDYYYNVSMNNYLSAYSSLLPYMGIDVNGDFEDEPYMDGLTWRDYFAQTAAEQMKEIYALVDDANASGFIYDDSMDLANAEFSIKEGAESAGVSVAEYYKSSFGKYATAANMEPFFRDGFLATAYYDELLQINTPTDEEIDAYYEDNAQNYDKVDYRSFVFTPDLADDATEEEIAATMKELKTKADAFVKDRKAGSDFEELCIANADEESKADYEDTETEHSLIEGRYYISAPTAIADWLFEDGRKENDIEVIEDEINHRYYVVEFIQKYYDEADDESISSTIASQRVEEYVAALVEKYEIVDTRGRLKYLTLPEESTDDTEAAE